MRTTKQIRTEIEKKEQQLRKHQRRIYEMQDEIRKLENTFSKALYREELESNPKIVNIVSVERNDENSFHLYVIKTDEGLEWATSKKLKVGEHKITQKWYRTLAENRERRKRGEF